MMFDAPYGTWDSPISAELASSAIVAFQDVALTDEAVYWSEMRPTEAGRYVIVKYANNKIEDVLPAGFNARTRIHEYGGAAFCVDKDTIYFTNFQDQRLYSLKPGQAPKAITQEGIRFADFQVTPFGIVAIAESHIQNDKDPKNFLALINIHTGAITELAAGHDFYSSPAVSLDNKKIAWISWDHPNMPWDNTQLWVADLSEKGLTNTHQIEANFQAQSFFEPQWGPTNELMVVSDKSNWWNLYRVEGENLVPLFSVDSEIGQPLWTLGASTFGFYQNHIVCAFFKDGQNRLFTFDGTLKELTTPYRNFAQLRARGNKVAFIAGAGDKPTAIVLIENGKVNVIKENMKAVDKDYLSVPEHITFQSGKRQAHAYFYAPKNKTAHGPKDALPPLIVRSHGGPTANSGSNLNLDIQYWTSRGFAFVDVNYAGSTGYGRAYRHSLYQNWGIYDVEDCINAAYFLANKGLVDKNKLAITGGSAGGYTTLAALAFSDAFHVGASHYGVSELEALVKDTHKFEARYLDNLIGPYPEKIDLYHERSPLYHVDKLNNPVIFFQGDEDKIVLPNQAQMMYDALVKKGIMTEYWLFKGEQHGFRKAENRITALEKQREFFLKAFAQNS
ncbi:MAG: S9 family peptidase [Proteobacteria bacterium]|nr:S9 family peptidase [Pseudomonadota bacterium]